MFLYNTTFAVDNAIENEVIDWLNSEFIPSAVDEEYFYGIDSKFAPMILRVLGGEPGVKSIAVHLYLDSIETLKDWYADHGARLFSHIMEKWGEKAVFFSTTLEVMYAG